ncbi:MAG: bZIP transcription factor [Desulfobacteraceae bacterium]|jgi:hypothetical protein
MKNSNLIGNLLLTILSLFILSGTAFAQDTTDDAWVTNGDTYVESGKVGIGTSNPTVPLDVVGMIRSLNSEGDAYGAKLYQKNNKSGAIYLGNYGGTDDAVIISGYGSSYFNGGNLGIGTTPPQYGKVDIRTNASNTGGLTLFLGTGNTARHWINSDDVYLIQRGITDTYGLAINNTGNVGIGTITPQYGKVDIRTNASNTGGLTLYLGTGNTARHWINSNDVYLIQRGVTDTYGLAITNSGNVGIGTTIPQSKLAVNGKITAEEVEVISNVVAAEFKVNDTSWSDFVFEDDYNLPTLTQVESYIKENKHLPDIPSAKEIEEEGLSMADMMKKQMQKIEELTLYLIEMKKENEELKNRVTELEANNM